MPYKTLLSLCLFLLIFNVEIKAQDWANLKRYTGENQELKQENSMKEAIVFMGNSITEGWKRMHPDFFEKHPFINRGISGQTTPQMLVRFRQDVIDLDPAAVVILAGINDIAGNTGPMTLEQIANNIFSMAELARANGIKVVLCSVLPAYDFPWSPGKAPAQKVIALNALIKTYAEEQQHLYVDYFSAMADGRNGLPKALAADGIHPTDKGYAMMEPIILKALERLQTSKR